MTIEGIGTFKLAGQINRCEPLLKVFRLKLFSDKPHMQVTYDNEHGYQLNFYDERSKGHLTWYCDMTLDEDEKIFVDICKWY